MKKILLYGTGAALLLLASAGPAVAQTTEDEESQSQRADQFVPIVVHDDFFILELGIGIDLEMRCGDQEAETAGEEVTGAGLEQLEEDSGVAEQPDGVRLGCDAHGLQVKAERLLRQLGITSDLAARIKERMERKLREEIVGRVKEHIEERLRERRPEGQE